MPPPKGPSRPIAPLALVRVSSEEQAEGWSLDEQTIRIQAYITTTFGVEIAPEAIMREEGVSGRPSMLAKRPQLAAALRACEAGQYTHFVVHKLDRLGRNVRLVSDTLERLDAAGVAFVSVQDHIDGTTAAGRLYVMIFLAIAQWYSDNLSEEVKKGKAGRKRSGLYNGHLCYGYTRGVDGVPIPDETGQADALASPATVVRLIFRLASEGQSISQIVQHLNAAPYRMVSYRGDRHFNPSTVSSMLRNRFYRGEVPLEKPRNSSRLIPVEWMSGRHVALIDAPTWAAAQVHLARHAARPNTGRRHATPHPFGLGIVHCQACADNGKDARMHMKSPGSLDRPNADHHRRLLCVTRHRLRTCHQPTVRETVLIAQMGEILQALAVSDDARHAALATLQAAYGATTRPVLDLASQRRRLAGRLERSRELYLEGDMSKEDYYADRARCQAELLTLAEPAPTTQELTMAQWEEAGALLANVAALWGDADDTDRADIIQTVFAALWVRDQRIVAVSPHMPFWPWFAQDRLDHVGISMRPYSPVQKRVSGETPREATS